MPLNSLTYHVGSNMTKVSVLAEKMFYLLKPKGLKCFHYVLKAKCILKSIRKQDIYLRKILRLWFKIN